MSDTTYEPEMEEEEDIEAMIEENGIPVEY